MTLTTPTHYGQGSLTTEHSSDRKLPTVPEMEPLQGERSVFYACFVQKRRNIAHLAPPKTFLQPATTAAMHCHLVGHTHPPPSVLPFLQAHNPSSKRIAPSDNMRPKLDDNYSHH